ncbi:MAG: DUF1987 domain-containing protein [Bacteroidales bacterium]|nr:DUF1987 domain-containing protein [Bacteroidales bacterium]MDD6001363.1 DUF1987 domain-containing protein [Bacteroidales bacterium]
MKPYIKTATADTPSVILDAERGIFEISQMSLPEDAVDFYSPILAWLREYAQSPNPETVFNMKLEYFNTASSKQLIQILLILQEMKDRSNVLVKWFYKEIDEDMLALGEEYKQIMQIPFELTLVP